MPLRLLVLWLYEPLWLVDEELFDTVNERSSIAILRVGRIDSLAENIIDGISICDRSV